MRLRTLGSYFGILTCGLTAVSAGELSATATLTAYAHDTRVTLNGIVLTNLVGGASQSIHLFSQDHSMRSQAPDDMAHFFSLLEGENVIEVTFEKRPSDGDLLLDLRIEIDGYDKPHFHMKVRTLGSGSTKRTFVVGEPGSDFETVFVDDESVTELR
ncbi:MAG TPA: hypothetical protein VLK65_25485 [Vicinamibacteria bacterium]|nr:hypothetical protein [Vicinamibacteria bacterium]